MKLGYFIALATIVTFAGAGYPKAGLSKCQQDSDCWEYYEYCTEESDCKHRDMFPARGIEIGAVFVFTFFTAFSNFAGIGGGFSYLALLLMFNFALPIAVILSNAQIMISGLITILTGLGKPHPTKGPHGTLFHFQIISLMIPMCSLGAAMAALISRVVPDLWIVIIYVIVLIGVFIYSLRRLQRIYKKETAPDFDPKNPNASGAPKAPAKDNKEAENDPKRHDDDKQQKFGD